MAFIKFSDPFRVGHFMLDQQHEELFALLSQLHELVMRKSGQPELQQAIAPLHHTIVNHFQTEESLMRNNAYPGYLEHKQIHEDLLSRLADVESQLKRADESLPLAVAVFIKEWLKHYLSHEDRRIMEHLESLKSPPLPKA
jgi:hemerythrin